MVTVATAGLFLCGRKSKDTKKSMSLKKVILKVSIASLMSSNIPIKPV